MDTKRYCLFLKESVLSEKHHIKLAKVVILKLVLGKATVCYTGKEYKRKGA